MKIATALCGLAAGLMIALTPPQAAAAYPEKTIRIVSGFAPGGSLDALARLVAEKLHEAWGQPVIVENKVGAGGLISAQAVAREAPDGYTLLMTTPGLLAVAPNLYPNLPYDPVKDFAPISRLVVGP